MEKAFKYLFFHYNALGASTKIYIHCRIHTITTNDSYLEQNLGTYWIWNNIALNFFIHEFSYEDFFHKDMKIDVNKWFNNLS
jgi:hypothetical protein